MHTLNIGLALPLALVLQAVTVSAGVFIQGFSDNNCTFAVGSVTLTQNNQCLGFNRAWTSMRAAGGGSQTCLIDLFQDVGCGIHLNRVGPISSVEEGTCFGAANNGVVTTAESAVIVGCPV